MRAGIIPVVVAAVSVLSCSSPTDPLSDVSAVVIPETVVRNVESTSGRVDVSLSFTISNPTARPLYYSHCSASLERQVGDGRWEYVASTMCLAYASPDPLDRTSTILAGQSREVGAFMSGYGADGQLSTVPTGTYRVRFQVLSSTPVVWQGLKTVQYKSRSLITNDFILTTD